MNNVGLYQELEARSVLSPLRVTFETLEENKQALYKS